MNLKVLSVTTLNGYIKKVLESDMILRNVSVEGEVSNFKAHSSGHLYFTLKDATSRIACVMFRMDRQKLKKLPVDGDKVTLKGRVSVYPQGGNYQVYVEEMIFSNDTGDLYRKFIEIKEKLSKEGLFDEAIKKPIPEHPRKIAIITSPTGAAIRDIIRVQKTRNPGQSLLIYPVLVQGEQSEREVIGALGEVNKRDDIDTIIIARGGGSIEDMWSFNSEILAYAIRASKIPVVTGIGHDIDYTIADFAADKRCATPSQAAEMTIPFVLAKLREVEDAKRKLSIFITERIKREKHRLLLMEKFVKNNDPKVNLLNEIRYVSDLEERIKNIINIRIDREKRKLKADLGIINAFNPFSILDKGYSIIMDKEGKVLKLVEEVVSQDELKIMVSDGETYLKVN